MDRPNLRLVAGEQRIEELLDAAAAKPIEDLAHRETLKAAIEKRLVNACRELRVESSRWVARRAAELVVDGGHDEKKIDRACTDFLVMRQKGTVRKPAAYFQTLLAKHFGPAWREWSLPEKKAEA